MHCRAVGEGANEFSGEHIPLLEQEGRRRGPKISRSHLSPRRRGGRTGEIIRPESRGRTDHPVCGDSVASRCLIYAAASPPVPGGEYQRSCCGRHTATLLPDGTALFTGGKAYRKTTFAYEPESAELYDPGTNAFRITGSMSTGRLQHDATLLNDGTVLVTGGYNV